MGRLARLTLSHPEARVQAVRRRSRHTRLVKKLMRHRNSIGIETDRDYGRLAARRLIHESTDLFSEAELQFLNLPDDTKPEPQICEDPSMYRVRRAPRRRAASTDGAV